MENNGKLRILSREYGRCGAWNLRGVKMEGVRRKLIGKKRIEEPEAEEERVF